MIKKSQFVNFLKLLITKYNKMPEFEWSNLQKNTDFKFFGGGGVFLFKKKKKIKLV